ncbi:MAG TPA: transcriptional regulator [Candidatus Thermoplasmatota archaeon]|nr:transcriptional regulator [Candidatus Thermoplasmatota archaeon]
MPLDPTIHQPTRLQILAALYRNREMSFTDLRDGLGLTPGNLGAHVAKLEEAGLVRSGRVIVDLTFELHYRITDEGLDAFRAYLAQLRALLGPLPDEAAPAAPPAR